MKFLLNRHPKEYHLSYGELALSAGTGFTALPYAKRHWESRGCAHKFLALVEVTPVLGGIIGLIERVVASLFNKSFDFPVKVSLPEGSILYQHTVADMQGYRPQMEDYYCYEEDSEGILAGVFDGHGGKEVSKLVCNEVKNSFRSTLKDVNGNVELALRRLINQSQKMVTGKKWLNNQGTTALICYINKKTNVAHTMTVGDSEGVLYRPQSFRNSYSLLPLSTVENWLSPAPLKRLLAYHGNTKVNKFKEEVLDAKGWRSGLYKGLNFPNSIGDVDERGTTEKPLVQLNPQYLRRQLQKGDVTVIATDGVWDYVNKGEVSNILAEKTDNLAKRLVALSYRRQNAYKCDNITAITIKCV